MQEGAKLLAEEGVEGFSLRKIAHRAGVTVAAPSHHFGSARGLLTAIATEGFARLATKLKMAAATSRDPQDALISLCWAYVAMAKTEPGYATVMFRLDLLDASDDAFRDHAFHAFDLLKEALRKAAPDTTETTKVSIAAKALWAAMHGLIALPMIEDHDVEAIIRFTVVAHLAEIQ